MHKVYVVLVGLLLSLMVAACAAPTTPAPAETGGTDTTSAETSTDTTEAPADTTDASSDDSAMEGKTTVTVMLVDYIPDVTDKWLEEKVVPAFQKENPDINVEFTYVNWGTLDETIQGYLAAGEGADIINLGSEYVAEYGDRLAPLNKEMDTWGELDQFVPATLDTVTWDGEVRGLPWLTAPRAIMCRNDLLKAGGIEAAPTTFAEAVAQAGATTKIENNAMMQQGFIADGLLNNWQEYLALIWSLGGTTYHEDGTPAFDTPEARAALEFMYNRKKAILPHDTTTGLPEATGSRLTTGEAACIWGNLWGAPATDDPMWENISFSPGLTDPAFPNAKPAVQVFNDWLAIPEYTQNKAAAVKFLQFLGSAENMHDYNEQFGSFPPRSDAWTGYVDNPVMQQMGNYMSEYGVGFADVRETAQLRDVLVAEIDAYFADLQDLDTTMNNIQTKYTDALKEAGRVQ